MDNPTPKYATVSWTAEDVKELRPNWGYNECNSFLAENHRHIQERMIEAGRIALETLIDLEEEDERL